MAHYSKSLNDEYENQLIATLDYVQPIGKDGKFETGIRSSFRDMVNDYIVTQQNAQGGFDALPGLDNYFIYKENIHGVYGILGNKTKKFSYQAGLRAEITDVTTILRETNQTNPRKYSNLFPTARFTYYLNQDNAFQVSYSRRVPLDALRVPLVTHRSTPTRCRMRVAPACDAGFRLDKEDAGGSAAMWHNRPGRTAQPVGDDLVGGKWRWVG